MQSKHRAAASSQRLWWHPQNATTCTVKYDAQKNFSSSTVLRKAAALPG